MLDLIKPLVDTAGPTVWLVGGIVVAYLFFVGVALFVALFSPDKVRADRAHRILRELLMVFTFRRHQR